jgi:hypothetical protein
MSDLLPQEPLDPRVVSFLKQFPSAKLQGFDAETEKRARDAARGPYHINTEPTEPEAAPARKEGTVSADQLAVIVAVGDSVHQFVLSAEQRQLVLGLIVKMHDGQPHLHAEPIENLNVEAFKPSVQIKN